MISSHQLVFGDDGPRCACCWSNDPMLWRAYYHHQALEVADGVWNYLIDRSHAPPRRHPAR